MDQATKLPLRASYILGVNLKNRDKSAFLKFLGSI